MNPKPMTQEEFLIKAKDVHGKKFDYSKVKYTKSAENVIIICKIHGEFSQRANAHLNGNGCKDCRTATVSHSQEEIIKLFKEKHGNKYDYSKVKYKKLRKRVTIICKRHKLEFTQAPDQHLFGKHACKACQSEYFSSKSNVRLTKKEILNRFKFYHGSTYRYPYFQYKEINQKIDIICKKHGKFKQSIDAHTRADRPQGCPTCDESSGETKIRLFLIDNKIRYITEWSDHDCRHHKLLRFDFYLPDLNFIIEYDGKQHFEAINFFGGIEGLKQTKIRDKVKNNWARKNNIKLIRIKYNNKKINSFLKAKLL